MRKIFHFVIILFLAGNAYAFDNFTTHKELTNAAIETSKEYLDAYLENNLDLHGGVDESIGSYSIRKLLREGSFLEDEPQCRASNHFHNPLRNWNKSGMRDQPWFVNGWCSGGEYPAEDINSAVHWATGYVEPAPGSKEYTGNAWDWDYARAHYFTYLTGQNLSWNTVAETVEEREEYFADSLTALGQVLHLLQDMAVPAHVRDDFKSHLDWVGIRAGTLFKPKEWISEKFEHFVKYHSGLITGATPVEIPDLSVTKFWDTDQYTGQDPDDMSIDSLGLAEYTNMNFASRNTIFSENLLFDSDSDNDVYYHPYPRQSSTNIQDFLDGNLLPETVVGPDGGTYTGIWIAKTGDGEEIDHFAKPKFLTPLLVKIVDLSDERIYKGFKIDDICAWDYADLLLPKAVGYSAGLLNYFFRGEMKVTSLPIFLNNRVYGIWLEIKNMTPGEVMKDGWFWVICRYTPEGGNPDGSDDVFIKSVYENSGELQYNDDATEFTFYFSDLPEADRIPIDRYDSIKCMLVFLGTLGNEGQAVVGQSFELEGFKFNEDWENGLYGTYPDWTHSTQDNDGSFTMNTPGHGEITNTVVSGKLVKENTRYGDGVFNENRNLSYYNYQGPESNYIPITPDTYVHMKFDNIWMTPSSTDPPNDTSMLISFHFLSNGLKYRLAYVQTGFPYPYNANPIYAEEVIYHTDLDDGILVRNIFERMENRGVIFSGPVKMTGFYISQYVDAIPTDVEIKTGMEVDFIRIVDSKPAP